ncbi:family 2 glycosyl transferase [Halorubrum coriense DSM 10284]|uniref:Family 2 glycosyl transferase n=1 Tax=Halorubrum coriense DSM 10284 TaxID=1227466 RepID=M0EEY8_9EURY|nr:glycosyltransferase family 2 protein [Halorubrum coriense]ELZ46325.1 family 2 glycosyl transferase [Halorubrum coriense DSM 10284]
MFEGATVAAVIPAYNEEGFVGEVVETVPGFVDRVYVVDDRSTDDTWAEIRETLAGLEGSERPGGSLRPTAGGSRSTTEGPVTSAAGSVADGSESPAGGSGSVTDGSGSVAGAAAASDGAGPAWRDRIVARDARTGTALPDRIVVGLRHRENTGVGGAIKTGYRNAMADDADIDVVAVMNGDGQMDPAILDRIIGPVVRGEADYAKGNRLRHAEYRRQMSTWRTFGNVLLTGLTRIASGYWRMLDPQNGYTAISRRALDRVEFESLYEDYGFCNHLLVRLNKRGLRIADVPMRAVYGDETSHIRYGSFVPTLSVLLFRSYLGRLLDDGDRGIGAPRSVAQLLGMGLLVGGVALATGSVLAGSAGAVAAGGVLALFGLASFLTGVAAERRADADLEVRVEPADLPGEFDLAAADGATGDERSGIATTDDAAGRED